MRLPDARKRTRAGRHEQARGYDFSRARIALAKAQVTRSAGRSGYFQAPRLQSNCEAGGPSNTRTGSPSTDAGVEPKVRRKGNAYYFNEKRNELGVRSSERFYFGILRSELSTVNCSEFAKVSLRFQSTLI